MGKYNIIIELLYDWIRTWHHLIIRQSKRSSLHAYTRKWAHTNMCLMPERYSIHCGWPLHPPPSATAAVRRWCRAAQYGMWAPTMAAVCGHHAVTASSPTCTPFCSNCCGVCLEVCVGEPGSPSGPWKRRRLVHSVACKHTTMQRTRGEVGHGKEGCRHGVLCYHCF